MKRPIVLFFLGMFALVMQGALASFFGAHVIPDFGFLFVLGLGLSLRPTEGLLLSAGLGYFADLLSGSLLGQWALIYVLIYQLTRIARHKLNLQGGPHQALLAFLLTLVCEFVLSGLSRLFNDVQTGAAIWTQHLVIHAAINALVAPVIGDGVLKLSVVLDEEKRRDLRLEARKGST